MNELQQRIYDLIKKSGRQNLIFGLLMVIGAPIAVYFLFLAGWIVYYLLVLPFVGIVLLYKGIRDINPKANKLFQILSMSPERVTAVKIVEVLKKGAKDNRPQNVSSYKLLFELNEGKPLELPVRKREEVLKIQELCKQYLKSAKFE